MDDDAYILSPDAKHTCESCPLHHNRHVHNQVTTEVWPGPKRAGKDLDVDVMFIAEAPGKVENQLARPVIGGTGKILRRLVRKLNGGEETGVAYGNIVRCRPADKEDASKDRPPTPEEINSCRLNILRDIARIKPKRIVLLGKSAAKGLAINPATNMPINVADSIYKLRGRKYLVRLPDGQEFPATITYHFAFVSRQPSQAGVFEEDVMRMFWGARGTTPDFSKRGDPVVIIDTVERVRKLLSHMVLNLPADQIVAMDYETDSAYRVKNDVLTIGFAFSPDKSFVIPYKHPESPWGGSEFVEVRRLLTKFFSTRKVSFRAVVPHNAKFECAVTLDAFGVPLWNLPLEDTMLRAHALNENRKSIAGSAFGLKALADEWLWFSGYEDEDIAPIVEMRNQGKLRDAPLGPLCEYNGMDCYVTHRIHTFEDIMADQLGYNSVLRRLGLVMHGPASMFAARMERNGILADQDHLRYLMNKDSPIVGRQSQIIHELRGLPSVKKANEMLLGRSGKTHGMRGIWNNDSATPWAFHVNKPASRKALFVDILNLDTSKTATGRYSFGKEFWKNNKGVAEVDLISEWTALGKLRGTYIDSIYKMLLTHPDMQDGRVRANFNFHKTATSRTSSDRPNMQNIPKGKTPTALAVKSVYSVEDGNLMICADYSQAEVRWLAQITGDPDLNKAFAVVDDAKAAYTKNPTKENFIKLMKAGDFHRQTASKIFGKPPQDISDDERGASKAIVFGIIYGMSVHGLAERLKLSHSEAEVFQNKFFDQFPEAKKWLHSIEKQGLEAGFVESPIGRRRHLISNFVADDENSFFKVPSYGGGERRIPTDIGKYKSYEARVCRNAPIQSIASDTNLMACINIQKFIEEHNKPWRLINIVHDSIIAEVPWPDTEEYIHEVDRIMTDPHIFAPFEIELTIPFVADFTIGPNWGTQVDVVVDEVYTVRCLACEKKRTEKKWPTNKRCEACGSKQVRIDLKKGPLPLAMKYLDHRYRYNQFWA